MVKQVVQKQSIYTVFQVILLINYGNTVRTDIKKNVQVVNSSKADPEVKNGLSYDGMKNSSMGRYIYYFFANMIGISNNSAFAQNDNYDVMKLTTSDYSKLISSNEIQNEEFDIFNQDQTKTSEMPNKSAIHSQKRSNIPLKIISDMNDVKKYIEKHENAGELNETQKKEKSLKECEKLADKWIKDEVTETDPHQAQYDLRFINDKKLLLLEQLKDKYIKAWLKATMLSGLEPTKMTQLAKKMAKVEKKLIKTDLKDSYIEESLPPMFETVDLE